MTFIFFILDQAGAQDRNEVGFLQNRSTYTLFSCMQERLNSSFFRNC